MKILITDNKKDEKFLRQKTANFDFAKFGKKEIRELVRAMRLIMKDAQGVGLSANQIGLNLNCFVAEVNGKFYSIFNPKLEKASKETITEEEGCLSVPNFFGQVARSEKVFLTGLDASGHKIKIKAWGLLARVFQHEADHLSGKLCVDKAKGLHKITPQ